MKLQSINSQNKITVNEVILYHLMLILLQIILLQKYLFLKFVEDDLYIFLSESLIRVSIY